MKNQIRKSRLALDITQQKLADKVSVSRQTIVALEKGRYVPSTLLALKISFVLGKNIEEVFELEDNDWR